GRRRRVAAPPPGRPHRLRRPGDLRRPAAARPGRPDGPGQAGAHGHVGSRPPPGRRPGARLEPLDHPGEVRGHRAGHRRRSGRGPDPHRRLAPGDRAPGAGSRAPPVHAGQGGVMKAIVVNPGKPDSVRLADVPTPTLADAPEGRGVLVRIIRVGLDGTDRDINAGEYGAPPPGSDYLIPGHESFGVVEQVGSKVTELVPRDFLVVMARLPGR